MNINFKTDFYIPIAIANKFPKITLDTCSLLVSISGKIGNVGLYNSDKTAFIGGAVGICKLLDCSVGIPIVYQLQSPNGQNYFNSLIKASSHANITVEDIRNLPIKLPIDKHESERISSFVIRLDNLVTLHQRE